MRHGLKLFFLILCFYQINQLVIAEEIPVTAFDLLTYEATSENLKILQTHRENVQASIAKLTQDQLKSEDGKILLKKYVKLENYLAINEIFELCFETGKLDEKYRDRGLHLRLLNNAGKVLFTKVRCRDYTNQITSIKEFTDSILDTINNTKNSAIQSALFEHSINNTVKTYAHFVYQFESKSDFDKSVVEQLCPIEFCSQEYQKKVEKSLRKEFEELKHLKPKQYSKSELVNLMNQKIKIINDSQQNLEEYIYEDPGYINIGVWDSSDPILDESHGAYTKYQQTYAKEAGSGAGLLLNTKHLMDHVGLPKEHDDLEEVSKLGKETVYKYKNHKDISETDLDISLAEAKNQMGNQIKSLVQMNQNKEEQKRNIGKRDIVTIYTENNFEDDRIPDLEKLLKTNPAAIGQILIDHPEYTWNICEILNNIGEDKDSDETWDGVFFWGGMVVGSALLVTGVGTAAGAWIIGGSITAGTLGTIAIASTVGALTFGVADTAYYGNKAWDNYVTEAQFRNSIISGLGDTQLIAEATQELRDFKSNVTIASLALGFSLLDLAALRSAIRMTNTLGKMTAAGNRITDAGQEVSRLKKLNKLLLEIIENPKMAKAFSILKKSLGSKIFAKLLVHLSNLSENLRRSILISIMKFKGESALLNQAIADSLNSSLKKGVITEARALKLAQALKSDGVASIKLNSNNLYVVESVESVIEGTKEYYELMKRRFSYQHNSDYALPTTKLRRSAENKMTELLKVQNANKYPIRYYDDETFAIATKSVKAFRESPDALKNLASDHKLYQVAKAKDELMSTLKKFENYPKELDNLVTEGLSYRIASNKLYKQVKNPGSFPSTIEIKFFKGGVAKTKIEPVKNVNDIKVLAKQYANSGDEVLGTTFSQGKLQKLQEEQAIREARLNIYEKELDIERLNNTNVSIELTTTLETIQRLQKTPGLAASPQYQRTIQAREFRSESANYFQKVKNYKGKKFIDSLSPAERSADGYLNSGGYIRLRQMAGIGGASAIVSGGVFEFLRSNFNSTYDMIHIKDDAKYKKKLREKIEANFGRTYLVAYLRGKMEILGEETQEIRRFQAEVKRLGKLRAEVKRQWEIEAEVQKKFIEYVDAIEKDAYAKIKGPSNVPEK